MVGVIIGSKKMGINPDNVATPIAASFGDLITLAILAVVGQGLYDCIGKKIWRKIEKDSLTNQIHRRHCYLVYSCLLGPYPYVSYLLCIFLLCLIPVWVVVSFLHPESRKLLYSGWEPIITALVISRSVIDIFCVSITDYQIYFTGKHCSISDILYKYLYIDEFVYQCTFSCGICIQTFCHCPILAKSLSSVLPHSMGGLILDRTVSDPNLEGMVVYSPVINGNVKATHYHL